MKIKYRMNGEFEKLEFEMLIFFFIKSIIVLDGFGILNEIKNF